MYIRERHSTVYNNSGVLMVAKKVEGTTTPYPCGPLGNLTRSQLIVTAMFSKDCRQSSIPVGLGTGAIIFVVVIIVVNHLMNREEQSQLNSDKQDKELLIPISSDCESLLHASSNQLVDDVFSNHESTCHATLSSQQKKDSSSSNPQITVSAPPNAAHCSKHEII